MSGILLDQQSVKIYEYGTYKPSLDDVLSHHGILGMHWGKRNGPPYPLGSDKSTGSRLKSSTKTGGSSGDGKESSKISRKRKKALKKARATRAVNLKAKALEKQTQESIEKKKEEIIKNKDIKSMLDNVDMFSKTDIENMLNRLDTERRLKEAVAKEEYANKSRAQKIKEGIKESAKEGLASGGKRIVKTVAKNAIQVGTKQMALRLKSGDPEWEQLINKLFKEEKK